MRRSAVPPVLALAVLLALPVAAHAVIRPQRGISGVNLNMTQAQVRAALGTPVRNTTGTNDFGPFREFGYRGGMRVFFQGDLNVTAVRITGPTDRTARGVGVGSTERSVRRRVRGARCETTAGVRSCHVGSFTPGRRVTDFRIRRGRVSSVTVAFVID